MHCYFFGGGAGGGTRPIELTNTLLVSGGCGGIPPPRPNEWRKCTTVGYVYP